MKFQDSTIHNISESTEMKGDLLLYRHAKMRAAAKCLLSSPFPNLHLCGNGWACNVLFCIHGDKARRTVSCVSVCHRDSAICLAGSGTLVHPIPEHQKSIVYSYKKKKTHNRSRVRDFLDLEQQNAL